MCVGGGGARRGRGKGEGGGVSLCQGWWCSMAHIYRTTYIIHTYMHARGIVRMHICIFRERATV